MYCSATKRTGATPPLRSIEEKRAKTSATKTATGRGEGYPPLPPPPLCRHVSPVAEVHDGSVYRSGYLFIHSLIYKYFSHRRGIVLSRRRGQACRENGGRGCSGQKNASFFAFRCMNIHENVSMNDHEQNEFPVAEITGGQAMHDETYRCTQACLI